MKKTKRYPQILLLWTLLTVLACGGNQAARNKLTFVTIDEELALGQQLAAQAQSQLPVIRNQALNAYFNQLVQKVGAISDWEGLEYKVYLINEPDANHFSLPGGHIFIFRGIMERCESTAELVAVIAHEVAHVAHRHGVGRLSEKYAYALAAQRVMGENPEIPSQIISNLYSEGTILDYPEDQELLADQKAVEYAWKANFDPAAYLKWVQKTRTLVALDPERVGLLYYTHPSADLRVRQVRIALDKAPDKNSLKIETKEFETMKNILDRIPY
jgi:predicted Zn-dependent protease